MRNMTLRDGVTTESVFDGLKKSGRLYAPGNPGIVPFNFHDSPEDVVKKGQFLCIGNTDSAFLYESLDGFCE